MGQIILASASPRRKELLERVGLEFEICPAKGEEHTTKVRPHEVVMELAEQKAKEVGAMVASYGDSHKEITVPQDILVIGADTVVACPDPSGGEAEQILGKPKDDADAFRMLSMLQGATHSVYTGVSLLFLSATGRTGIHTFYEKTDVVMQEMAEEEIKRYIASGEPADKAGAYAIQGKCAIYIDKIIGDYNNVVGLPVAAIHRELKKLGIDWYRW
jgi:septum formation protein